MAHRIRSKLAFVNVVALFVALGGASYVTVTLPANSIGSAQVRNGAVTAADIVALNRPGSPKKAADPEEVWNAAESSSGSADLPRKADRTPAVRERQPAGRQQPQTRGARVQRGTGELRGSPEGGLGHVGGDIDVAAPGHVGGDIDVAAPERLEQIEIVQAA